MNPKSRQSFRLFRVFGIDVRLHWMWFLVATYEFGSVDRGYGSMWFNLVEYVSLFAIVLLHEFGHALACRQVGGKTEEIVLWPLGGVAYVSPPPRPGALLWSIAAGPLVNVALIPVFFGLIRGFAALDLAMMSEDGYRLLSRLRLINYSLLIFNLLPIYPLDGGQILRALLWYPLGRMRSLKVASLLGLLGALGLIAVAVWAKSVWIGVVAVYMITRCWSGFQAAGTLATRLSVPRRPGYGCPSCQAQPPIGDWWQCSGCQHKFDTFESQAACPNCQKRFTRTACLDCGRQSPMEDWRPTQSIALP